METQKIAPELLDALAMPPLKDVINDIYAGRFRFATLKLDDNNIMSIMYKFADRPTEIDLNDEDPTLIYQLLQIVYAVIQGSAKIDPENKSIKRIDLEDTLNKQLATIFDGLIRILQQKGIEIMPYHQALQQEL